MTDAEVADQIARADRFIADFREMIAGTVVDHASACTDSSTSRASADRLDARRGPVRDDVRLANLDAAMRGGLLRT